LDLKNFKFLKAFLSQPISKTLENSKILVTKFQMKSKNIFTVLKKFLIPYLLGTDDGMFISMQTILKNTDENLYFDRVRETFGLTRSEKISISPLTIEGNIMKHVSTIENSGKHTCDIHVIYEKVSDTELKMTNTIDDVTAIREFKKAAE